MSTRFAWFFFIWTLFFNGTSNNFTQLKWKWLNISNLHVLLTHWKVFIAIRLEDETAEEINDGIDITGPYFDANIPNNVTAIVGKSAFLRCRVRNLTNKTVSKRYLFILFTVRILFHHDWLAIPSFAFSS